VEKEKISCPCRELNTGRLARRPSPYRATNFRKYNYAVTNYKRKLNEQEEEEEEEEERK
jgi:hypothetical protein